MAARSRRATPICPDLATRGGLTPPLTRRHRAQPLAAAQPKAPLLSPSPAPDTDAAGVSAHGSLASHRRSPSVAHHAPFDRSWPPPPLIGCGRIRRWPHAAPSRCRTLHSAPLALSAAASAIMHAELASPQRGPCRQRASPRGARACNKRVAPRTCQRAEPAERVSRDRALRPGAFGRRSR